MSLMAFVLDGECGFSGVWNSLTSAQGFNKDLCNLPQNWNYWVRYTTGAVNALQKGETLTGGTSGATAKLISYIVENGTAGSGDSGLLLLWLLSGTPTATGETWTGSVTSGTVVTAQAPIIQNEAGDAKSALITVETATVNFTQDGTTPTVTSGTNFGHEITAGQSYVIRGHQNIYQFKAINSAANSGAVIKYSLFY